MHFILSENRFLSCIRTSCTIYVIGLIIKSMDTIRKIISNIVFQVVSLILCCAGVAYAYYARTVLKCSFMKLYIAGYIGLILSFLVFLAAYNDKEADTKTSVKESISGYVFFLFFIGITLILRG